jgi:hypothetical protein
VKIAPESPVEFEARRVKEYCEIDVGSSVSVPPSDRADKISYGNTFVLSKQWNHPGAC